MKLKTRNLPKMFLIALTISLSACVSRPDELITKQRFIQMELVEINGKMYVDPELSFCLEREYKYSLKFLGPIEKFRAIPFLNCDKLTGQTPRPYVDTFNFLEDVREEIEAAQ